MSAYVISEVQPRDAELIARYRELAGESIGPYGGRYLVRGGELHVVEGTWPDGEAVIIMEFPSMDHVRRWYDSPEYAKALEVRQAGALDRRLLSSSRGSPSSSVALPPDSNDPRSVVIHHRQNGVR